MSQGDRPHREEFSQTSDEELARQVRAGSLSCFAEIVYRHEGRLMGFLARRTHSVHDAEDLLQETFGRAFERIGLYDPAWRLSTWLFTIASRLCASHHRRAGAERLGDAHDLAAPRSDPAAAAARREENDNLWAAARRVLSENQLSALWLRYVDEMSVKEIAAVMGKTQTHVKVLLFRARSRMARCLKADRGAAGGGERSASVRRDDVACLAHRAAKEGA
jgi:RNA polymerase sigma-70 factor (ECF subfamily)